MAFIQEEEDLKLAVALFQEDQDRKMAVALTQEEQDQLLTLKSVNSNFTLAVRSRKFGQAKTHFLSHHNVFYINRFANFPKRDQWSNG